MLESTTEKNETIGKRLIEILKLRKDKDFPGRYQTVWGNKTATGIALTVEKILKEGK